MVPAATVIEWWRVRPMWQTVLIRLAWFVLLIAAVTFIMIVLMHNTDRQRQAMTIEIGTRFTALEDFYAEETQSGYVKGLGYTVQNEKLGKLVERWISEGKVELGGFVANIQGKG